MKPSLIPDVYQWKAIKSTCTQPDWKDILSEWRQHIDNQQTSVIRQTYSSLPDEFCVELLQQDDIKHDHEYIFKYKKDLFPTLPNKLLRKLINGIDRWSWEKLSIEQRKLFTTALLEDGKYISQAEMGTWKNGADDELFDRLLESESTGESLTKILSMLHKKLLSVANFEDINCSKSGIFRIIPAEHPLFDLIISKEQCGRWFKEYVGKLNKTQLDKAFEMVSTRSSAIERTLFLNNKHCSGKALKSALTCVSKIQNVNESKSNNEIIPPLTKQALMDIKDENRFLLFKRIFVGEADGGIFKTVNFDKNFNFDEIESMLLPAMLAGTAKKEDITKILNNVERFKSRALIGKSYLSHLISMLSLNPKASIARFQREDVYEMLRTSWQVEKHIRAYPEKEYDAITQELNCFVLDCLKHKEYEDIDVTIWNEKRCKTLSETIEKLNLPKRERQKKKDEDEEEN